MMTSNEHTLFEFALSGNTPSNDDEQLLTELHAALGTAPVPSRLQRVPAKRSQRRWQPMIGIAAAALLILSLVGAVFQNRAPSKDSESAYSNVPSVVMGLSSPDQATGCDTSTDYPVIEGVDESPIEGTAVILTTRGELNMTCPGESTTLLTDVSSTLPSFGAPNTLFADTGEEYTLVNTVNGATLKLPEGVTQFQMFGPTRPASPTSWFVLPSTDDRNVASAYDSLSMQAYPLIDSDGQPIQYNRVRTTSSTRTGETLIAAIWSVDDRGQSRLDGYASVSTRSGVPAEEAVSFVSVETQRAPQQIAISNDGSRIASAAYGGEFSDGKIEIVVTSAVTGEIEASWSYPSFDGTPSLGWTENEAHLIFSDGSSLYQWNGDPGAEPEVLIEAEEILGTSFTKDPGKMAISARIQQNSGDVRFRTFIIDLESGNTVELEGVDMFLGGMNYHRTTLVLTTEVTRPQEQTIVIADASTGAILGEISVSQDPEQTIASSAWGLPDNDLALIAFNTDSMWLLIDPSGNPTLEKIDPPELDPALPLNDVIIGGNRNGDVSFSVAGGSRAWIRNGTTGEWVEVMPIVPEDDVLSSVFWVEGAAPSPNNDATPERGDESADTPPTMPGIGTADSDTSLPYQPGVCATDRDRPLFIKTVPSVGLDGPGMSFTPAGIAAIDLLDTYGYPSLLVPEGSDVRQTPYPNLLLAEIHGQRYLLNTCNLTTNNLMSELTLDELESSNRPNQPSPWFVVPDQNTVVNTRTGEVHALNGTLGRTSDTFEVSATSSSADGTTLTVAISPTDGARDQLELVVFREKADPEIVLVARPSHVDHMVTSPDGSHVVLLVIDEESSEQQYAIINLSSGEIVRELVEPTDSYVSLPAWVEGGDALVYPIMGTITKVELRGTEPTTIYETYGAHFSIRNTRNPNVVLVQQTGDPTIPSPLVNESFAEVIVLNVVTGEVVRIEGNDLTLDPNDHANAVQTVALVQEVPDRGDEGEPAVTVIDATTSDIIGRIERGDATGNGNGFANSYVRSTHGDVHIVSWGSRFIFQVDMRDGDPTLLPVEMSVIPGRHQNQEVTLRSSSDSTWLLVRLDDSGTWYLYDVNTREWIELPGYDMVFVSHES